jgi:uncharacterized Fe-S center protein
MPKKTGKFASPVRSQALRTNLLPEFLSRKKATSNGTTTNNNGEFSLTVGDNATIIISTIGFETQEVAIAGRTVVDVKMVPAVKQIDQVVVIGYGTPRQQKRPHRLHCKSSG